MRNASEFDLVVVSDHQFTTRLGHKRCSKNSPLVGASWDVVQVWLIAAKSTSARHGLIERGMNTIVGCYFCE